MDRRQFLAFSGVAAAATQPRSATRAAVNTALRDARLPDTLAGMTLPQLRDDYRDRLFRRYLPFWDKGGCDQELGGFLCELNDDGSVATDEKFNWYQGRGIWVYSFLYNHLGKDPRWLNTARKARDFMVRHMYAGDGRWYEKVHRDGSLIEGVGPVVYGWLFAAAGLAEYWIAAGREEDLDLAKKSILAAAQAYDDPAYFDAHTAQYTPVEVPRGMRSQGHSMVLVGTLSRLLSRHEDRRLAALLDEHVDRVVNKFWNPKYGIANEYLNHNYTRVPGADIHMLAGHALETLWIVMEEARRRKDRSLFDTLKGRIRRLLEMCYDYVFEGWSDDNFFFFEGKGHGRGPGFEVKTMWAHCEAMVACMLVLRYTGEAWAREWYERLRAFTLRTMPVPEHGVWRQAVDRFGKDLKRVGVSTKRKDNYHQARYLMMDILSLDEMITNQGKPSGFPA